MFLILYDAMQHNNVISFYRIKKTETVKFANMIWRRGEQKEKQNCFIKKTNNINNFGRLWWFSLELSNLKNIWD